MPRGKRESYMLWRGFQKPKRLAVEAETLTETFGKFSAQPFERGFGTTIGNALRRTLLSSIEGAAVTAVRIEGVLHEFQSKTPPTSFSTSSRFLSNCKVRAPRRFTCALTSLALSPAA
jgi:RNA polymerase Rpb3/Rpb11 dimerisation domain